MSEARTRAKTGSGADFSLTQEQSFVTVNKSGMAPLQSSGRLRRSDRLSSGGSSQTLIKDKISKMVPNIQGIIGQLGKAIGAGPQRSRADN